MKVILDKGCREIDGLSGRRYGARNGVFEVNPKDAKGVVAIGGAVCSLSGTTRRSIGFRCETCGFGTYFSTCSRCGGEAIRECKTFADCF